MQEYEILKIEMPKKNYDRRTKPNSPRLAAVANGQVHFIGNPCKYGHNGLRYTKGANCVECARIAKETVTTPRGRSLKNHTLSLEAAKSGQTTYTSNRPCKFGHWIRFVNSNNCVQCDKDTNQRHKISAKFSRIKKLYNLSKEEYLKLVQDQNSSCKLCAIYTEDHFRLHVDHCHETNKIRGLLCGKCNQGIGLLNHNPDLIRKAALYCEAV